MVNFMFELHQNKIINDVYSEYLNIVELHKDTTRHSLFCNYYRINDSSSFDNNTKTSISTTSDGITYDLFENTPLLSIDPVVNNIDNDNILKFSGDTRIVVYSIESPKINDLIVFPFNQVEIYRVKDINVSLHSKSKFKFKQLTIEYSTIKNVNKLNIINEYKYLLPENINIRKKEYLCFMNDIRMLDNLFKISQFDELNELYMFENYYIDLYENKLIYDFLLKFRKYFSITLKIPFGILKFEKYDKILNLLDFKFYNSVDVINNNNKTELIQKLLKYELSKFS